MQTKQGKAACIIKRIVAVVVVIAMILGINRALRYFLIDDVSSYTRLTMHEFYDQDNIDVLVVGASHAYRGFIPSVLSDRLGQDVFNAGSSRQPLDVSYALIQEAVEKYDIKQVYLEMSLTIAAATKMKRTEDLTGVYIITDYLKPSLRKCKLLAKGTAPEYYANSFLPARRNWDKLLDREYIADVLEKKSTDTYKNYEYIDDYAGKGYVPNSEVIEENTLFSTGGYRPIKISNISEDWIEILPQIVEYCSDHDVELSLIATPITTFRLAGCGNYDEYDELINGIIEGTGTKYYNFNLCREEYFPDTSTLFSDDNHLNKYGAEIFSNLLADLVTGGITKEDLFCDSCEEKVASLKPGVYGLSYKDVTDSESGEKVRRVKVVSNRYEGMEFRILIAPEEGEPYLVQEFSEERYFKISPDAHGVCTVEWRMSADPGTAGEVNIAF